jgi:hypothetical protein
VKTSDLPSFSSSNVAPFISVKVLRASDISPVPSLNLKPNPRGGTAKKIKSSPFKKFDGANQKEKIRKATKSQTQRMRRMFFLVPRRDGIEGFAAIQLHLTLYQIRKPN